MYTLIVLSLLFILPAGCAAVQHLQSAEHFLPALLNKWFIFWGAGIRLLMAGGSQVFRPRYTANLLGLQGDDVQMPIRELGFANLAIGVAGALSVVLWSWRFPVGVIAIVFYGLAGLNHLVAGKHGSKERFAMLTDLAFAALLLVTLYLDWRRP